MSPVPDSRPAATAAGFSGLREGLAAYRAVAGRVADWLLICGPWLALVWAAPAVIRLAIGARPGPAAALGGLIGFLLLLAVAGVVMAIAWFRLLLQGRRPQLAALPDGAMLSISWRVLAFFVLLFLVSSVVLGPLFNGGLARAMNLPWPVAAGLLTGAAAIYAAVVALIFPAIAVGDRRMKAMTSMVRARRLKAYLPGLVLAAGPYWLFSWGFGLLEDRIAAPDLSAASFALWALRCLVMGFWLCVGATYLARAYEAAAATSLPDGPK